MKRLITLTLFACTTLLFGPSLYCQSTPDAAKQQQSMQLFYGPDGYANAVREFTYVTVRDYLRATGRDLVWTSGHREADPNGKYPSKAHAQGAVDYRTNDISSGERHVEAKALSKILGSKFTVVVEEEMSEALGGGEIAPLISETSYCNGIINPNPKRHPPRGPDNVTHTHVQITKGKSAEEVAKSLGLQPTTGSFARLAEITDGNFFGTVHKNPGSPWNLDHIKLDLSAFGGPFRAVTKEEWVMAIFNAIGSARGSRTQKLGTVSPAATGGSNLTSWRPSLNPSVGPITSPIGPTNVRIDYGGPTMAPGIRLP